MQEESRRHVDQADAGAHRGAVLLACYMEETSLGGGNRIITPAGAVGAGPAVAWARQDGQRFYGQRECQQGMFLLYVPDKPA